MRRALFKIGLQAAHTWVAALSRIQVLLVKLLGRTPPKEVNQPIHRILIIKLDELGDLAMAMPFLSTLREQLPKTQITLVVNRSVAGLLAGVTDIKVLPADVKCSRLLRPLVLPIRHYRFVQEHLHNRNFDICFIPRRDADDTYATFLSYFAGAKRRISFSEKSTPRKARLNHGFDKLLTDAVVVQGVHHETVTNLRLLEEIGIYKKVLNAPIAIPSAAINRATELLPPDGSTYVALCPSAGHSELKQWGVDRFGELARTLNMQGFTVVLVGAPDDQALGEKIEAAAGRVINMIGKTSLLELAALLSRCHAFFGNDAGPMHVASLMRIKTVAVFGASCHHRFGPWAPSSSTLVRAISCSPCADHEKDRCKVCVHGRTICMDRISSDDAAGAITALLKTTATPVSQLSQ